MVITFSGFGFWVTWWVLALSDVFICGNLGTCLGYDEKIYHVF